MYMYPITKLMVCLDLSEMDDDLIRYASFVALHSEVDKIYFVNIVKNLEVPKEILKKFPDLKGPVDENILDQMKEKVEQFLDNRVQAKVQFEVREGHAVKELMKLSKLKTIDLAVLGRKRQSIGSGQLPLKLSRSLPTAILIVPENTTPELKKILVPIDESLQTGFALDRALKMAKSMESNPELICQGIYTIPEGYHRTGKSYMQFARIMREHSQQNFKKLLSKMDTGKTKITEKYTLDSDRHPVPDILRTARQHKVGLIVIGAKAITHARALLRRSVAEKLVAGDDITPLLIVRQKKNVGVVESLKNL